MPPFPYAMKLPIRANPTAVRELGANTSPLVTKAYWPFKLALLYLPTGGGGVTVVPAPPEAALQRAAAGMSTKRMSFIPNLPELPSAIPSYRRHVRAQLVLN